MLERFQSSAWIREAGSERCAKKSYSRTMPEFTNLNRRSLLIVGVIVALILFVLYFYILPGKIILPSILNVGPLHIRLYGICLALAALVGYWLATNRTAIYNIDRDKVDVMVLV